ncbi:MAG: carboxypeptidase-like regulatory domain-containing protein [Ignavibacteria bacterium]|jgi:hypothetical protein|nr:carboxypeptidase-like regulatory domain-containing protein [Ignavibacteria bacterium]MCU7503456.1 carboxypeptidase-like regulatory domain-containing protein [Ignavibacteria bacterium]MCU7516212.1 carboxypeptidase-like regulatory domain-containing protein [Ignavibacteria bacterium]
MRFILPLLLILLLFGEAPAQQFKLEGRVLSAQTGKELSYASLRVINTLKGTSSNAEGVYQILLPKGSYKIIASYIGFISDTLTVELSTNRSGVNFSLAPVSIHLPEVTILPGKNPALEIIRRAILSKEIMMAKLESYQFEAYTKGVIRSGEKVKGGSNYLSLSAGGKAIDTSQLKIQAILENQSMGFFKKPGMYKEQILARKQSANLSASFNLLTGGRIIQSFYSETIRFFDRPLPGPVSKNALDYYYYYIKDTLALDNEKVYEIYFEPDRPSDPGFKGLIYITDSTFKMIKVDVELNRAANVGGLMEKVRIFQQFLPFGDDLYMPVDYRLFVRANLMGLARLGIEINSVMYNYSINNSISDDFFNKAILTVMPQADARDSLYWTNAQSIPNTLEEVAAYRKIDSIKMIKKTYWDNPVKNILSGSIAFGENFSVSGPLGLYHFNRVEGHVLEPGIFLANAFNRRVNSSLSLGYGFSDKKFKQNFSASYLGGDYRTWKISFNAYDKLSRLFEESDYYDELTSTVLALFTKYEFRNYYYSRGASVKLEGEVFPVVRMGLKFTNRTDNSAYTNTDYSFFARRKQFSSNPPVYETKINAVEFSLDMDFRNYIEDGYFRRRTSEGNSYVLFGGSIELSDSRVLKSLNAFTKYNLYTSGTLNTFRSASLGYRLYGTWSNGGVPYQWLYALPGNINLAGKNYTFRTLRIGETFGDRVLSLNLEHNFRDELFRISRIPGLRDMELEMKTFFSAAWTGISSASERMLPFDASGNLSRLYEAGFSIGHALLPLSVEFTWRLNHREKNGFVIGVNVLGL